MHGLNQFNAFKAPGHLLELKGPHSYYNCHNIHILRKDFISIYNTKNLGTLGDDLILAVGAMTFRFFDYKYGLCFRHMSFVPLLHLIDNWIGQDLLLYLIYSTTAVYNSQIYWDINLPEIILTMPTPNTDKNISLRNWQQHWRDFHHQSSIFLV